MCVSRFGRCSFVLLVIVCCVSSSPIIIRSGVVKNQGQQENANLYDAARHKGISNMEADEGFNKGSELKSLNFANVGRYGETAGKTKDFQDINNFDKGSFYQNGGGQIADFGNKIATKKGHHKSGFHNSYHKDEQGSNSSFYDDSDDHGDQYTYKTQKGAYGDVAQGNHRGGNVDASHYANEAAKQGQHSNVGAYERDAGQRQNYNRNNYYDGREQEGVRNAGNNYGEGGNYQAEKYVDRPHHYYPPPKPYIPPQAYHEPQPYREPQPYHNSAVLPPKRHITIYEDPRYSGGRIPYRREYNDDYVELDVRPLDRGYHNRRPYDYY